MRAWWAQTRAAAAALRGPLVVGGFTLAFVLGWVAAEADGKGEPRVVRVNVPVVAEPDLDRLVGALEANTAAQTTAPTTVTSTAESIVDAVESGEVAVVPEVAPASPPVATAPPTITTTTVPPTTTTTDPVIRYEPHDP